MKSKLTGFGFAAAGVLLPAVAQAQSLLPKVNIGVDTAKTPQEVSGSLQILLILTVLSLAPALLIMLTSFTRIVIVLSFTRSAIGAAQVPPNTVLIGLALFLTFFTMAPIWSRVNQDALQPYMHKQITLDQATDKALVPLRGFMFKQTRENDIALFVKLTKGLRPKSQDDVPTHVLIPAFLISELKTAFTIGFVIYTVPDSGPGGIGDADVHGHDDAATRDDLTAVQDTTVCARRRLAPDRSRTGAEFSLARGWMLNQAHYRPTGMRHNIFEWARNANVILNAVKNLLLPMGPSLR